jgi:hypothetical protein
VAQAQAAGASRITAPSVEGPRNAPGREFFAAKYLNGDGAAIDLERIGVPSFICLREEN